MGWKQFTDAVCRLVLQHWTNEKVENEMNLVESVVKSYRSLRAEMPANERNERLS